MRVYNIYRLINNKNIFIIKLESAIRGCITLTSNQIPEMFCLSMSHITFQRSRRKLWNLFFLHTMMIKAYQIT